MKDFIIGLLLGILIGFFSCLELARADFRLIEMDETYINFKQYLPNGYSPFLPPGSTLSRGVDLQLNTDVLAVGYVNNKVWSLMDQHQFRAVGWNYQVGVRLNSFIDVEYEHFSRHVLDAPSPTLSVGQKYPVEDSINIKFYLFRADKKPAVSDL